MTDQDVFLEDRTLGAPSDIKRNLHAGNDDAGLLAPDRDAL
jgi:hypothetical protein